VNNREDDYAGSIDFVRRDIWSAGENNFTRAFNAAQSARLRKRCDLAAGAFKCIGDAVAEHRL